MEAEYGPVSAKNFGKHIENACLTTSLFHIGALGLHVLRNRRTPRTPRFTLCHFLLVFAFSTILCLAHLTCKSVIGAIKCTELQK